MKLSRSYLSVSAQLTCMTLCEDVIPLCLLKHTAYGNVREGVKCFLQSVTEAEEGG